MMATEFVRRFKRGQIAESLIARWLMRRGNLVLPAYEVEGDGKGPRIFCAECELVSPDLVAFKGGPKTTVTWIEAKSKAAFTWYRKTGTWQDGIDARHWRDYLSLANRISWPVWILFLHAPGQKAKDTPEGMTPPTGLFGGDAIVLKGRIDHYSPRHGPSGMVYWNKEDLTKMAEWADVAQPATSAPDASPVSTGATGNGARDVG